MDPDTERQLAAMIMEEASRLRHEAERDGVAAYLAKPKIRGRANPQFLQATVRSIQQSNRIVEVNEMWRRRNVELEYEQEQNRHWRRRDSPGEQSDDHGDSGLERRHRHDADGDAEDTGDEGLKDEELEQFLNSRLKRGRGAVGSRMDETGPYLPSQADMKLRALMPDERMKSDWEERIAGPFPGPTVSGNQMRDLDRENWKRKRRDSSVEDAVEEELHAKRTERQEKKLKKERDSKRLSKKKKRKKLEKTSKRCR